MNINKIIGLCLFLCLAFSNTSISANSAMTQWEGTTSSSSILLDEDCPITVEKEVLTFDLNELPQTYYDDIEEFQSYSGRVSAEYTFYNPTDMGVKVKLAFPFGRLPMYSRMDGNASFNLEQYNILINDEPIEKELRYTYSPHYSQFELEKDLPRLRDGLIEDDFYNPQMEVTRYVYKINDVDKETYDAANIAFDVDKEDTDTRFYLVNQSGLRSDEEYLRISSWVDDEDVVLYTIGEALEILPEWKVYENGGVEDGEEIEGSLELIAQSSMSFEEFVFQSWNEEFGISKIDWYNAQVEQLNEHLVGNIINDLYMNTERFMEDLMVWYEYEYNINSKETIKNVVTAPMYPSIDQSYEPSIYEYLYLLSPATTWSEFNDFEVVIRTPHHLIDSSLEFEECEEGYVYRSDGLPKGELAFTLSQSSKPEKVRINLFHPMVMVFVIPILLIVGLVIGVIVFFRKMKHK